MAKVVAVHGINQAYKGRYEIRDHWLPTLKDGLERADYALESDEDFDCAFYGDFFRQDSKSGDLPEYTEYDIELDWEKQFLLQWWTETARLDSVMPGPNEDFEHKGIPLTVVQQALRLFSRHPSFSHVAQKVLIHWIKQVSGYLYYPELKRKIRNRVVSSISKDTRVLIGHSLGSIVCYEVLCEHPEWPVEMFISLGSPLGIQNAIFSQLDPLPTGGLGQWPGSVKQWVNIADKDDIVALEKKLDPFFRGDIQDCPIDNGIFLFSHNGGRYLNAKVTGEAIKAGLNGTTFSCQKQCQTS